MIRHRWPLAALGAIALLNLTPLIYMGVMSLYGPAADDAPATLGGPWLRLWQSAPLFARWLGNSALVAGFTVTYHVVADSMAGYVLAKRRFRGRALVFALILLAMMAPRQVTLIPLFLGMARFELIDTMAGIIMPGLGDVIGVFLMRQYFVSLPDSLIEAARIDGASEWQTFRMVAWPMARPAVAVLAVLAFLHYWSDFLWPLVAAGHPDRFTVQVGLTYLARSEFGPQLSLMAAGATAAALPVLIAFIAARRWFFEGARSGALRG
jgi:multiple sugar transport system permease protein